MLLAIEHARANALPKPWGVLDLRPWSVSHHDGGPIGELWYERGDVPTAIESSLLLKLLFTSQSLSIQVHPDDAFARSIGLPHGKTEAWYVLNAVPEAKVALGLKARLTAEQLRGAIDGGTISNFVRWQTVLPGDVIFVPAGTIHAIGAGLVIAEIQQRSDATFRIFDYGSRRELHIERAIAVADAGPIEFRAKFSRLTDSRTLLVSNVHFVLEKIELAPNSAWRLEGERETWFLVLEGTARFGSFSVGIGDAVFLQSDGVDIDVGAFGMIGLVAYTGVGVVADLLQPKKTRAMTRPQDAQAPPTNHPNATANQRVAIIQ